MRICVSVISIFFFLSSFLYSDNFLFVGHDHGAEVIGYFDSDFGKWGHGVLALDFSDFDWSYYLTGYDYFDVRWLPFPDSWIWLYEYHVCYLYNYHPGYGQNLLYGVIIWHDDSALIDILTLDGELYEFRVDVFKLPDLSYELFKGW